MDGHLAPGTLLLSAPEMLDPNFMHAVVLMVHHDEDGAMGVVVNARMETRVGEALPEHPVLKDLHAPLWQGGPVGMDSLQVLHRHPEDADLLGVPGVDVGDGVRVGADLEWASQVVARGDGGPDRVRFIVGYSGWAAGQLEDEIATYSWLPLEPCADLVFGEGSRGAIWRRAMARLEGRGSSLAHLPPDPSWN